MERKISGYLPKHKIELSVEERASLERLSRQYTAPYRAVVRSKALLLAADGKRNIEISQSLGVERRDITIWRREFVERRLESLKDCPRTGRPRFFPSGGPRGGSSLCLSNARFANPN